MRCGFCVRCLASRSPRWAMNGEENAATPASARRCRSCTWKCRFSSAPLFAGCTPPSEDAWSDNCLVTDEDKATMSRFWSTALLGAALMGPIALAPRVLRAEDQKAARNYHDKQHNDDHAWNGQEDKAYRIYAKQNHRKSTEFSKLKDDDQQNYWNWRHEHSDALLKIEIR